MAPETTTDSTSPPGPLAEDLAEQWRLDPSLTYLNHGSYGARPHAVARAQDEWRSRIEHDLVVHLDRSRDALIDESKRAVGAFLGMDPPNFGFVTNASGGVNSILRSIRWEPGDEVLALSHVYNAVRQTMRFIADRYGVTATEVELTLPVAGDDQIVELIERRLGPRTRLLIIDHITSPSALVLPVERIVRICRDRGIDVLVDGAHAPGMLALDVEAIGAAYYTGNLHKWVCAPLGTAFLWVHPERQDAVHPLTISHFFGDGLADEFNWQGTRDISGWLAAPAAIEFFAELGWERVRRHNHEMAVWVQRMLCRKWSVEPISPLDGSMLGSMVTLPLPDGIMRHGSPRDFMTMLHAEHRIEVPIDEWHGRWWIRCSCQVYNTADQYERLADVILELAR
jgi:isopenicillin-N epimerase